MWERVEELYRRKPPNKLPNQPEHSHARPRRPPGSAHFPTRITGCLLVRDMTGAPIFGRCPAVGHPLSDGDRTRYVLLYKYTL